MVPCVVIPRGQFVISLVLSVLISIPYLENVLSKRSTSSFSSCSSPASTLTSSLVPLLPARWCRPQIRDWWCYSSTTCNAPWVTIPCENNCFSSGRNSSQKFQRGVRHSKFHSMVITKVSISSSVRIWGPTYNKMINTLNELILGIN